MAPVKVQPRMIATHVLVPNEMKRELKALARRTRRTQRDLLDQALDELLAKHQRNAPYNGWDARFTDASLVFRLPKEKYEALQALAKRTRIVQSALVREAIADLLEGTK